MNCFVLDASFILSAILEYRLDASKKIKDIYKQADHGKTEIYSIPLLPLEVANGLRFQLRDEKKALLFLEKFSGLSIRYLSSTPNQVSEILTLSYKLQTTVYDTSYHFLAIVLDGIFLTCDREYFHKAKKLGFIELVI